MESFQNIINKITKDRYLSSKFFNDLNTNNNIKIQELELYKNDITHENTLTTKIDSIIKTFKTRMDNIISVDSNVKVYNFGTIKPKREFSVYDNNALFIYDSNYNDINSINKLIDYDITDKYYNVPIYSRKAGYTNMDNDARKFESINPFSISIKLSTPLANDCFFVVETTNGIFYSKTNTITLDSWQETIVTPEYYFNTSRGVENVNPAFAYAIQNKLNTSESGYISTGVNMSDLTINTIEILNIFIGKSKNTLPITETIEFNLGNVFKDSILSLSTSTYIEDTDIMVNGSYFDVESSIQHSNKTIEIQFIFKSDESIVENLSILGRKV